MKIEIVNRKKTWADKIYNISICKKFHFLPKVLTKGIAKDKRLIIHYKLYWFHFDWFNYRFYLEHLKIIA